MTMDSATFLTILAMASVTYLEPVLRRVTCPLLAIHGVHDEYGTTRHPRMIADLSSGPSRIEILPDTYHVPHREKERAVVELVKDFIASMK